jgi:ABC-2 type transport system permease protein
MHKILIIAWREFIATIANKGFILGMILPPVIITAAITFMPLLMNQKPPTVFGEIAIIDHTGKVAPRLESALRQEAIKGRRGDKLEKIEQVAAEKSGVDAESQQKLLASNPAAKAALQQAFGEPPNLTVRVMPSETDVDAAKQEILKATGREREGDELRRLALVVVPSGSVDLAMSSTTANDGTTKTYEQYQVYVAPRLDPEVQGDLQDAVSKAIVDTRIELQGLDPKVVRGLIARPGVQSQAVTKEGDRKTSQAAGMLIPAAFMFLMWISVFTAGQYLLTSTIEEKSSRVMEVLLSAASPMQMMLGKILGKGAVGVLVLTLYSGAGIAALVILTLTQLIAWQSLLYLAIYFVIAYLTIACLMAAIGAAVTEVAEAQALMGPIMMILIIPMMLWMPILRNPNSTFAQVCSFVPLINPFVMVLRVSGSETIPFWQIPASILVGMLTVVVLAWASAKIFRIGVLMYGKPPNLATLIRWVRMA